METIVKCVVKLGTTINVGDNTYLKVTVGMETTNELSLASAGSHEEAEQLAKKFLGANRKKELVDKLYQEVEDILVKKMEKLYIRMGDEGFISD